MQNMKNVRAVVSCRTVLIHKLLINIHDGSLVKVVLNCLQFTNFHYCSLVLFIIMKDVNTLILYVSKLIFYNHSNDSVILGTV